MEQVLSNVLNLESAQLGWPRVCHIYPGCFLRWCLTHVAIGNKLWRKNCKPPVLSFSSSQWTKHHIFKNLFNIGQNSKVQTSGTQNIKVDNITADSARAKTWSNLVSHLSHFFFPLYVASLPAHRRVRGIFALSIVSVLQIWPLTSSLLVACSIVALGIKAHRGFYGHL